MRDVDFRAPRSAQISIARRRLPLSPIQFPPSPDAFHRKLGRFVGDTTLTTADSAGCHRPIRSALLVGRLGKFLVFTAWACPSSPRAPHF